MPAPFEDEVMKFIASKRPLKLMFLVVAAVGVLASAFTTVRPLFGWGQPLAYRLLDIKPPDDERERYECAYYAGAAQWDLPMAVKIAQSQTPEVVARTIQSYQVKLAACGARLGYSAPSVPPATTAERADLPRILAAVEYSLHSLSGSLAIKDRVSYAFFRAGAATANVVTQMRPSSPDDRRSSAVLAPFEVDIGRDLERALTDARSRCLCRIPMFEVKVGSRQELMASATAIDEGLTQLLVIK